MSGDIRFNVDVKMLESLVEPAFAKKQPITANMACAANRFFSSIEGCLVKDSLVTRKIEQITSAIDEKILEGVEWGFFKRLFSAIKNYFVFGCVWEKAVNSPRLLFQALPLEARLAFFDKMNQKINMAIIEGTVKPQELQKVRRECRDITDQLDDKTGLEFIAVRSFPETPEERLKFAIQRLCNRLFMKSYVSLSKNLPYHYLKHSADMAQFPEEIQDLQLGQVGPVHFQSVIDRVKKSASHQELHMLLEVFTMLYIDRDGVDASTVTEFKTEFAAAKERMHPQIVE